MLRLLITFVYISINQKVFLPIHAEDCFINIEKYNPEPVIVSSGKYEFLYPPVNQSNIIVPQNTRVLVTCPRPWTKSKPSFWDATCVGASTFKVSTTKRRFPENFCEKSPYHIARYTGMSCGLSGQEIEIGFQIEQLRFIRLMLVCFDKSLQSPMYSFYKLTKSITKRTRNPKKKPAFLEGTGIYNIEHIDRLYIKENQRRTINRLVGLPGGSTKYITEIGGRFLSRGHIGAKGDFLYEYQKIAVTYFMNCAPQWKQFNSNNWKSIEFDIRQYTSNQGFDLDIYSGIYGVATLPHERTGKPIELYLYVNEMTEKKALPVPDIFWKVLYNPKTKEGVAFILHNNLYDKDVLKRYICKDVSEKITWFTPLKDRSINGHGYACTVHSLSKFVKTVPALNVKGLMK